MVRSPALVFVLHHTSNKHEKEFHLILHNATRLLAMNEWVTVSLWKVSFWNKSHRIRVRQKEKTSLTNSFKRSPFFGWDDLKRFLYLVAFQIHFLIIDINFPFFLFLPLYPVHLFLYLFFISPSLFNILLSYFYISIQYFISEDKINQNTWSLHFCDKMTAKEGEEIIYIFFNILKVNLFS